LKFAAKKTTTLEIQPIFPDGIDYLITPALGPGHITGVSKEFKTAFSRA